MGDNNPLMPISVANAILSTICVLFILSILRPLYKMARDRNAFIVLFSKCSANLLYTVSQSIYFLYTACTGDCSGQSLLAFVTLYLYQWMYFVHYWHVFFLALNRFTAVFFPYNYGEIWTKKLTILCCFIAWPLSLACDLGNLQGHVLFGYIGSMKLTIVNSVQFLVLFECIFVYGLIMVKFLYEYHKKVMHSIGSLEKDRVLLSLICLFGLTPLVFNRLLMELGYLLEPKTGNAAYFFLYLLIYINLPVTQCVEEFCLLIYCKEFRKLVRRHYIGMVEKVLGKHEESAAAAGHTIGTTAAKRNSKSIIQQWQQQIPGGRVGPQMAQISA